jgi:hypothetical protein
MPPVAHPLSIPVNANQLDAVDEVCRSAIGCGHGAMAEQLLLLVVTGVLAVVLLAAAVRVREALPLVREEQSRTATEQEAFNRFARVVSRLDAPGPAVQLGPSQGATSAVSATMAPRNRGLDVVRSAYEDTVLAMEHYDEEYDEPAVEHMRHELGDEVATAVEQNQQLTTPLQQALVARAREAAMDRERLMTRLNREFDALEEADEELTAVADAVDRAARPLATRSFPELTDEWNRLGELESRLRRLLSRRQEARTRSANGIAAGEPSLNAYLYEPLDTSFPVLADGAALADRVKDVRRRVLIALTRRA